jgi:hypothetical protein
MAKTALQVARDIMQEAVKGLPPEDWKAAIDEARSKYDYYCQYSNSQWWAKQWNKAKKQYLNLALMKQGRIDEIVRRKKPRRKTQNAPQTNVGVQGNLF